MNETTKEAPLDTPSCSAFYGLFAHMSENHGLTLTDSELADICDVVDATRHPIVSPDVIARMKSDITWMQHLLATIRYKADIRYGNNRGVLAFSDLKALAASSLPNAELMDADQLQSESNMELPRRSMERLVRVGVDCPKCGAIPPIAHTLGGGPHFEGIRTCGNGCGTWETEEEWKEMHNETGR